MIIMLPVSARICRTCGDRVFGEEECANCARLGDRYDTLYHAYRAAKLFVGQPRVKLPDDGLAWDGLGGMRGAAVALKLTAVVSLAAFALGLVAQLWTR